MFLCRFTCKLLKPFCIKEVLLKSRCNSILASPSILTMFLNKNIEIYPKILTLNKSLHILKQENIFYLSSRNLFSSDGKIPEYLKGIISEVSDFEEEALEDIELENSLEDEIIDFLYFRAYTYEELEGNFIVRCPSCGHSNKTHEMFIDKNSGYSVCPWCLWDGCWQDFMKLVEGKLDTLEPQQLENFFLDVKPLIELHSSLLSSSVLMNYEISHLRALEAGITEDHSQLIFPLKGETGENVGFASISLVHTKPEVIMRLVEGHSSIFYGLPLCKGKKKEERVIIVPSILEALYLTKFRFSTVVLIADPKPDILISVFKEYGNVVLWLSSSKISPSLLISLKHFKCFSVRLTANRKPLTTLFENKIIEMISNAVPILSEEIITSSDLQSSIFERVLNKDKLFGVKWKRFNKLNELLLGHREGELTIFSGQTGSGKTTLMSEYSLDLSMQGVRTLWGSFEVNVTRLCEVMLQQFSGQALPEDYSEFSSIVQEFSKLPLYFLNLHGQQQLENVIDLMTEAVLLKGVHHVIIDNLQFMLGQQGTNSDWWLMQDRTVGIFRQFATNYNCHVTLIVHPKKLNPGEKLGIHSISGGARVTQEADNVMILHVPEDKDGTNRSILGPKTLQVVKNRYGGTLGEMKLKFHKPSLTLSSCFRKPKDEPTQSAEHDRYTVRNLPFLNSKR